MPLMYTFCTWLPLRLGSIIVGLISMVSVFFSLSVCHTHIYVYVFIYLIKVQLKFKSRYFKF